MRDGNLLTKSSYRTLQKRIISALEEQLGHPIANDFRFYYMRHTVATNLYYDGVVPGLISAKQAAYIMGNKEDTFLKIYAHLEDESENTKVVLNTLFLRADNILNKSKDSNNGHLLDIWTINGHLKMLIISNNLELYYWEQMKKSLKTQGLQGFYRQCASRGSKVSSP